MKVYTKTGDKKTTGVIGGRVDKSSLRIESYGTIDEALSKMGVLYNYINDEKLKEDIVEISHLLFIIGKDLATLDANKYDIDENEVVKIEKKIDVMDSQLEDLTSFILPFGSNGSCVANNIRTIIRRAERRIVSLSEIENINNNIIPLINRLSDYFFVLSRYINKLDGFKEMAMHF